MPFAPFSVRQDDEAAGGREGELPQTGRCDPRPAAVARSRVGHTPCHRPLPVEEDCPRRRVEVTCLRDRTGDRVAAGDLDNGERFVEPLAVDDGEPLPVPGIVQFQHPDVPLQRAMARRQRPIEAPGGDGQQDERGNHCQGPESSFGWCHRFIPPVHLHPGYVLR